MLPPLEGYDYKQEYYPVFSWEHHHKSERELGKPNRLRCAIAAGAETMFSTWAEQLVTDDTGAVVGAYVHDADGAYTKINAKQCASARRHRWQSRDARLLRAVGRRILMRVLQQRCERGCRQHRRWTPYGHVGGRSHGTGSARTHDASYGRSMGINSYLQLNMEGKRFMNEDIPGQNIADQMSRQPSEAKLADI